MKSLEKLKEQALVHWQAKNLAEARIIFKKILKKLPNDSEILTYSGIVNLQLNNFDVGVINLRQALRLSPENQTIKMNLANGLTNLSIDQVKKLKLLEASATLKEAIKLIPNNEFALINLLKLNVQTKNYEENLEIFEKLKKINSKNVTLFYVFGNSLFVQKKYKDALEIYKDAIKINPEFLECYFNIALCYRFIGNNTKAFETYDVLSRLDPSNDKIKYFKSLFFLSIGDYSKGWDLYKYRWQAKKIEDKYLFKDKPLLKTLPNKNEKILIWSEQGIGDVVLHSSLLEEMTKHSENIIVAVDNRLINLYQRSFKKIEFISMQNNLSNINFDKHLPLADIGSFFRTKSLDFQSQRNSFLEPQPELKKNIRDKLGVDNKIICGISCYSANNKLEDKNINLNKLLFFLKDFNFKFINLDYIDNSKEIIHAKKKYNLNIDVINEIDKFNDLDSFATLVSCCDLVITISNITAHFAGALGIKTYLLLSNGPAKFWYWYDDKYSKWYPSIEIQENKENNWEVTFKELKKELSISFD